MPRFSIFFGFALVISTVAIVAQTSGLRIVQQAEFSVVGIEARTSGQKEMSNDGLVPQMWQRFYQEGVLDKIPSRADQNVYALYTDFASNRMGEYTVVIGAKVKDKSQVPAGMALKTIPAGKYAVLTSAKGPAPSVIPEAWMKIAAMEDKDQLGGKRAYKADFEVYGPGSDPQNSQADLYVGLK